MPHPLVPTAMDEDEAELLSRKTVYDGFGRVEELSFRHKTYEGGRSDVVRREVYAAHDSVTVLPYDARLDAVVLIEQFRALGLLRGEKPWIVEAVAGLIDRDASPEEIARAEALEEAGCELDRLFHISSLYTSPGLYAEKAHIYCATADLSDVGGIHGLDGEHEDIRAMVVGRSEALAAVADGRIADATTVVALQWLELNRTLLADR